VNCGHQSWLVLFLFCVSLGGCESQSVQSMLAPQSSEAERILRLFWSLSIGGGVIVIMVVVLLGTALSTSRWRQWIAVEKAVIAGGIILPVTVLTVLLVFDLLLTRTASPAPTEAQLRISIRGEQWWWRISYAMAEGQRLETANELYIPVGVPVALELTSADVIHSFWVPKLAGKLDMIPGRKTLLHLQASEPGVSRGQCAEYCGGPHAFMSFHVVALEQTAFQAWLSHQAAPAAAPLGPTESRGSELFLAAGCGGCHSVRGTGARGTIGPDLTHVASRLSLAAATLPNETSSFARWIVDNQHIKPENRMPPFRQFTETQLTALSAYLSGLR
jgi:cytochrome c oxidase subunit II